MGINKLILSFLFPLRSFFSSSSVLIFAEGYNSLRRKFGPDSFWVNGPYHAIMTAITPPDYTGGSPFSTIFNPITDQFNQAMGTLSGGGPGGTPGPQTGGLVAAGAAALVQNGPSLVAPLRQAVTSGPFDSVVSAMNTGMGGVGQPQPISPQYGAPAQMPPVAGMPYFNSPSG